MSQAQLSTIVDTIIQELEVVNQLRDETLQRSRNLVRACAHSIRAIHRHEMEAAVAMLEEARSQAESMVRPLVDYPELTNAGYTQDSLKELVEAHLVFAFVRGLDPPQPAELHVSGATYLKGMSEAATEMRRFALDLIRRGEVEAAEPYLDVMDEVYALQISVDFPDVVTQGLRRQTDILRSVLERTRGDLTMAVRQEQMRRTLRDFEARLGLDDALPNESQVPLADDGWAEDVGGNA